MGGIANGIAYHGGFIPYAATFLTFSDYMRGSVRLAALSGLHVIYVWTHDSVGLGEDGPTHQPIEHYAALRAIPNLWFIRPGDANEAVAAWAIAVERGTESPSGPIGLSADPPEAADAARNGGPRPRGRRARRLRPARGVGRGGRHRADPHRDRLGVAARVRGRRGAREGRRPQPRRLDAVLGAVRAPGRGVSRERPAGRRLASGSPSRPGSRSAGSAGSATRARSSVSTISARRRRPGRSSRSSASPWIAWPR